jgi:putative addiction module killer protein
MSGCVSSATFVREHGSRHGFLRLSQGNAGDVKRVGSGVSEMRIDYGPGYRVYFTRRGPLVVLLLCGGDKRTQDADIKRAIEIVQDWED